MGISNKSHTVTPKWRRRVHLNPIRLALAALLIFAASLTPPAHAVQPDEILKDPALEERARDLGKYLRCIVCQNQSIDDSNAPLARDLRIIVRERLTAGDTDDQAMEYIVARYGNFVLLKPPFQFNTLALWLAPAMLMLLALWGFRSILTRRTQAPLNAPDELTAEERRQLQELLERER